jgi:hypothetical protein
MEFEQHRSDWDSQRPLTYNEFDRLQALILESDRLEAYCYPHQKRLSFAIIADVAVGKRRLERAVLAVDPDKKQLVGLWKEAPRGRFRKQGKRLR